MEFTNDIKFNKKPKASKLLKITYSGALYKNNSQEVSIVYGFGENWEKTTEQKMYKNSKGFSYNILMENYNTFNFCFKNENNEWDNNNSFNYIAPISIPANDFSVNSVSSQEAQSIASENIDNIINNIDINIKKSNDEKVITTNSDSSLLDSLIQELFEEYSTQTQNQPQTIQEKTKAISENYENNSIADSEFDKYFDNYEEPQNISKFDSYTELSEIFDELVKEVEIKNKTVNIGQELNQIFDQIFDENHQPSNIVDDSYLPINDDNTDYIKDLTSDNSVLVEKHQKELAATLNNAKPETNAIAYIKDLTSDNSVLVEKHQKELAATLNNTNPETNAIAYIKDLTSDNSVLAQKYQAQNSNLAILNEADYIVKATTNNYDAVISTESILDKQNVFDFENLDFEFNLQTNAATQTISSNNFSDSFYDDEDISTHVLTSDFQEIVDYAINNLSKATQPTELEKANTEYQIQSEAFDKAVSEYADYFDTLIDEIVMSPVTSLSSPVSNEQVFENEQTDLAIAQNENTAVANTTSDINTDETSDQYALYDYKNHSFIYMMKRRFKLIFNSLFTKIPKIFGKETDTNNN